MAGKQIYAQWINNDQAQSPPGNGDLFGIAMTPGQQGLLLRDGRHQHADAGRPVRAARSAQARVAACSADWPAAGGVALAAAQTVPSQPATVPDQPPLTKTSGAAG